MSEDGNHLWVWQIFDIDKRWGTLAAFVPAMGQTIPFAVREREVAEMLRPLALGHGESKGCPVRLALFALMEVVDG